MKAIPTPATGFISRIGIGRFYKLSQLAVLSMFMTDPAPAAVAPPADSELSRQADALLNDYAESGLFTGTVLVARGGRPIGERRPFASFCRTRRGFRVIR